MATNGDTRATPLLLRNEFASVTVEVDHSGNGPRLRVEDRSTGVCIFLDPIELQSLA